jgi:hypothetical protein
MKSRVLTTALEDDAIPSEDSIEEGIREMTRKDLI